jgi:hypothetical protein
MLRQRRADSDAENNRHCFTSDYELRGFVEPGRNGFKTLLAMILDRMFNIK